MLKIKAFTIIELVVTMVITSIVIGIAVALYLSLDFYFRDTISEYDKDNNILLTGSMIKHDIINAKEIVRNNSGFTVIITKNKKIRYDISDQHIIREINNLPDTILCSVNDLTINTLEDNTGLVNEIIINIGQGKNNIPLHFYKQYENDVLFELDK